MVEPSCSDNPKGNSPKCFDQFFEMRIHRTALPVPWKEVVGSLVAQVHQNPVHSCLVIFRTVESIRQILIHARTEIQNSNKNTGVKERGASPPISNVDEDVTGA